MNMEGWEKADGKDVQSFAKNAGLYGERVGALHVVPPNTETANRVKSQLSVLQRSEISNPPSHGARLVGFFKREKQEDKRKLIGI